MRCVCLLAGILLFFTENFVYAAVLMSLGPLLWIQAVYTLLCGGMVTSSGQRRMLETTFLDFLSFLLGILLYAIIMIAGLVWVQISPEKEQIYLANMLGCCVVIAIFIGFMSIGYKVFFISYILFMMGFITAMDIIESIAVSVESSLAMVLVLGALVILLGVGVSAVLRRALYKKPVSLTAVGGSLRKSL